MSWFVAVVNRFSIFEATSKYRKESENKYSSWWRPISASSNCILLATCMITPLPFYTHQLDWCLWEVCFGCGEFADISGVTDEVVFSSQGVHQMFCLYFGILFTIFSPFESCFFLHEHYRYIMKCWPYTHVLLPCVHPNLLTPSFVVVP